MLIRSLVPLVAAACLAAPSWAGEGSAERGIVFANGMCKSCHAIAADETASPVAAAPTFRKIGEQKRTAEELTTWFNTDHPTTGRSLKNTQAEDILAYIATFKTGASN